MNRFGRRHAADWRDHEHLMRALLPPTPDLPARKTWPMNPRALDQGHTGTCVGHGWRNFLRCAPIRTERGGPSAFEIYRGAVQLDEWAENDDEAKLPDGDPGMDFGTSVRAGAKWIAATGHLTSYVWSFSLQPVVEWVLTRGPVVVGTNWYTTMSTPDGAGVAHIEPGASVAGGHCYLIRGASMRSATVRCVNSWGELWGVSGEFWLTFHDLERLIREDGEACSAVEKHRE